MLRINVLLLLLSVLHTQCLAADKSARNNNSFVIAVIYDEGPPFFSLEPDSQAVIGIFADFLHQLGSAMGLNVTFLPTARNKIEQDLILNRADGAFLAPQWLTHPEKLIFTAPILIHKQYFYSLSPLISKTSTRKGLRNALKGKTVCIRQDYVYPELDGLIEQKIIARKDISDQQILLNKLINHHCELIYMNDLSTQWLLATQGLPNTVFRSSKSMAADHVPLALSPKWADRLEQFNAEINKLLISGEIQRIVQQNLTRKMAVIHPTL